MRENQIARSPGKHRKVVDTTNSCAEAGGDGDSDPDRGAGMPWRTHAVGGSWSAGPMPAPG